MPSLAGVRTDWGGKSIDGRADEVKDGAAHGEYGTKRVILEIYEEMARSMRGGAKANPQMTQMGEKLNDL